MVRAATWTTAGVSSPAILNMLGTISRRPCEAVKVVPKAPACKAPCDLSVVAGYHRVRMCELAAAALPGFSVSDMETRRTEPSYTILTLRALKETLARQAELVLLVGEDNLPTLHSWRNVDEILNLATVAILPRPAAAPYDLLPLRAALGDSTVDAIIARRVPSPLVPISSTEIRARIRDGRPITSLVPAMVADYIAATSLYKSDAT